MGIKVELDGMGKAEAPKEEPMDTSATKTIVDLPTEPCCGEDIMDGYAILSFSTYQGWISPTCDVQETCPRKQPAVTPVVPSQLSPQPAIPVETAVTIVSPTANVSSDPPKSDQNVLPPVLSDSNGLSNQPGAMSTSICSPQTSVAAHSSQSAIKPEPAVSSLPTSMKNVPLPNTVYQQPMDINQSSTSSPPLGNSQSNTFIPPPAAAPLPDSSSNKYLTLTPPINESEENSISPAKDETVLAPLKTAEPRAIPAQPVPQYVVPAAPPPMYPPTAHYSPQHDPRFYHSRASHLPGFHHPMTPHPSHVHSQPPMSMRPPVFGVAPTPQPAFPGAPYPVHHDPRYAPDPTGAGVLSDQPSSIYHSTKPPEFHQHLHSHLHQHMHYPPTTSASVSPRCPPGTKENTASTGLRPKGRWCAMHVKIATFIGMKNTEKQRQSEIQQQQQGFRVIPRNPSFQAYSPAGGPRPPPVYQGVPGTSHYQSPGSSHNHSQNQQPPPRHPDWSRYYTGVVPAPLDYRPFV